MLGVVVRERKRKEKMVREDSQKLQVSFRAVSGFFVYFVCRERHSHTRLFFLLGSKTNLPDTPKYDIKRYLFLGKMKQGCKESAETTLCL